LPEHLSWRYYIDRLVLNDPQVATLTEIRTSWSIHDVMNYNELLDMRQESDLRLAEARKAESDAAKMARAMKKG
jgi:hypothetical protein